MGLWVITLIWIGLIGVIPVALAEAPESHLGEAPVLSLERLLEEVLKVNPEIEAARQIWEAAKQEASQAGFLDDPELIVTQWAIPSNFNLGRADETWYGIGQAFPFFGKRRLRSQMAATAADAAEQAYQAKIAEQRANVKSTYYKLALVDKTLELHLEHQTLLEEFIKIAEKKYAVGQVSQQDLIRAQVELSKLHNTLLVMEQEKSSTQAEINRFLNRLPQSPLGKPEALRYQPVSMNLEALTQQALQTRPELKEALLTQEKSETAIALAKRNSLPDFMAEIQYWNVHGGSNQWMAMGKINLPWIFKGKYDAGVRKAAAEAAQARADYQALWNQTMFEIHDLFIKIKTAEQLIEGYQKGVLPQAEQSLRVARIGYQNGKVDFLNLLESDRALRDLQLSYYTVLTQFHLHWAMLERVIGEEP